MNRISAAGVVRPKYILLALGVIVAGAGQAHAAGDDRWYLAAALTGSALDKPHQTIANAPIPGATLQVTNNIRSGWGGQAALGRRFGDLRLEAEIGRVTNKSTTYAATSPIQITLPQKGRNDATRYMADLYYDLPQGGLPVRPYLGVGVGAADARVTTFAAPARAPAAPPSQLLDIRRTVFAYQLMAGLSAPVAKRLVLTAQYRWFDAGTIKGRDSRGEAATRQMAGSNLDLGLRLLF